MRQWLTTRLAGLAVALVALAGCAPGPGEAAALRIMVPNPPGSGYDLTARTLARTLEDAGIVREVQVFNLPGGHGTVGLHRLVYERGNDQLLMLMGLGVIGSQYAQQTRVKLTDTTPVARLIEEPNMVVVTHDSPYRTLDDLVQAWRTDPSSVSVGGGSAIGGPDHLATMLLARAAGIDPARARYVRYDGGGALLAAILGRHVTVGMSGLSEYATHIRSGQLRALAVTSEQRVHDLSVPTARELGVEVVFTNWRGVVAPPGLTDSQVADLRDIVDRMHDSDEWHAALLRNRWTDAYLTGESYTEFVRAESERVGEVLTDLGLSSTAQPAAGMAASLSETSRHSPCPNATATCFAASYSSPPQSRCHN